MKRIYLSLLPCLASLLASAQEPLNGDSLASDFRYLVKELAATHPDPYSGFGGKVFFYEQAFHLENELRRTPGTKQTFFDKVSIFLSNLQDGHTYLLPPTANQQANQRYLALEVRTIPDGIILQGIPETYKDLLGSRITTINGDSLEEVLARTAAIQASENLYDRYANLCRSMPTEHFLRQLFPEMKDNLHLSLLTPDGKSRGLTLPLLSRQEVQNTPMQHNNSWKAYTDNPLAELNEVKIMLEKLRISLIFINLVLLKSLSLNRRMHNLYTKFVRILEICKQFSNNLVNDQGNIVRCGPVPKFSDLEVVALSLAAESESIDSEKWLFDYKLQEYKEQIPNLISRRQFNDRRKKTAGLCEAIRKRIALKMDGGEDFFLVDSKPVEVCRLARGKRCKMGQTGDFSKAPDFGYCASQNTYYFGYKLHAVCGLSGVVHSYDLSKASVHDLNYMKDIKLEYHNCSIYGDKGYIGADVQLDLFETAHIRLECPYRLNQKDWKPTFIPFAKARKRIETIFSQLSDQFLIIRNYAKITNGLFARIIGKISALTVSQYANYINNKPIGRIKYALN